MSVGARFPPVQFCATLPAKTASSCRPVFRPGLRRVGRYRSFPIDLLGLSCYCYNRRTKNQRISFFQVFSMWINENDLLRAILTLVHNWREVKAGHGIVWGKREPNDVNLLGLFQRSKCVTPDLGASVKEMQRLIPAKTGNPRISKTDQAACLIVLSSP